MAIGGIRMTEWDAPDNTFELFVDQQVFVDAVRGNEQVEEFSALTEVTTFEQRGENLYLEGNVLFTAYLADQASPDSASDAREGAGAVEHLQHRMPFDLSLPASAQEPGLLSVSVHVPDATLDILGPGWIHLRAVLEIEGLKAAGGYTAHCGAQEAIVPPLVQPVREEQAIVSESLSLDELLEPFTLIDDQKEAAPQEAAPPEELREEIREEPPLSPASLDKPQVQQGSPLREPASASQSFASSSALQWQQDLQGADRALHGTPPFASMMSPFKTGRAPRDHESSEVVQEHTSFTQWVTEDVHSTISHLSAELTADKGSDAAFEVTVDSATDITADIEPDLTAATRGDDLADGHVDDDFHFHFEHVNLPPEDPKWLPGLGDSAMANVLPSSSSPEQRVLAQDEEVKEVEEVREVISDLSEPLVAEVSAVENDSHVQATYKIAPEPEVSMTTTEWFWKSLNVPSGETHFTMKFRIVQASETLDDIAQVYRVSLADLVRANPSTQDGLSPGALLYIPMRA